MYSAKAESALAKPSVVLRYRPYNIVGEKNVVINDGYPSQKLAPVLADMIPIEREEVHRTGSVLRRDLTFEEVHMTPPPAPTSLRDCITYGVLDMFNASKFICSLKKKGAFCEGSYQEFVRFAATYGVKKFCFAAFKNIATFEEYRDLHAEATQLITDIHVTRMTNFDKKFLAHTPEPCGHEYMGISFSASNFTRNWVLAAEKPFLNVDLVAAAMAWIPKSRDNKYVQALSLFRFLLNRITEPSNSIKQYAVRVNGRNGRDDKLKNLPDLVESTLLDCAEDMLGYGREELRYGAVFDKSTSRFFLSLGKDDDERCTTFEHLLLERSMWRKQLLKALQRALNDIRCHKFDI